MKNSYNLSDRASRYFRKMPDKHVSHLYRSVIDFLSVHVVNNQDIVVLDGNRIFVPHGARKDIVRNLHDAHSASQLYYWPAMKSDIQSFFVACHACQEGRPLQPRHKLLPQSLYPQAMHPMRCIGLDLFSATVR